VPDDAEFDPTLAPPSDPYTDDVDVTPAAHDLHYDPTGEFQNTTEIEKVDEAGGQPPAGQPAAGTWSGRAGVRPPTDEDAVPGDADWNVREPERSNWLLPVIFAVVLVLLVGLLGLGLWLSLRNDKTPVTPASTGPRPTSAAPTSASPSATPSATVSASATIASLPDLTGLSYAAAVTLLTGIGLVPERVDTITTDLPAGYVIRTDPAGPRDLPVGTKVRLFVAVAPPPTTAPATPSPTPSPTE